MGGVGGGSDGGWQSVEGPAHVVFARLANQVMSELLTLLTRLARVSNSSANQVSGLANQLLTPHQRY